MNNNNHTKINKIILLYKVSIYNYNEVNNNNRNVRNNNNNKNYNK